MKVATKNICKVIYSDREDVFTYHHQSSTIVNFARFFEWKVVEGKGHIKLKAVWVRRLNLFCLPWKAKSKRNKFIRLFFGRIYGASICFPLYLTFKVFDYYAFFKDAVSANSKVSKIATSNNFDPIAVYLFVSSTKMFFCNHCIRLLFLVG